MVDAQNLWVYWHAVAETLQIKYEPHEVGKDYPNDGLPVLPLRPLKTNYAPFGRDEGGGVEGETLSEAEVHRRKVSDAREGQPWPDAVPKGAEPKKGAGPQT